MARPRPGQPTKYKKEYCEMLIKHMARGLSFECFGAVVDASKQTLYDWCQANDEFLDAKQRGNELSRLFYEEAGINGMMNKIPFFNSNIWTFSMKNKFRDEWKDQFDVNEKSKKSIKISGDLNLKTDQEVAREYKDKVEND